MFSWFSLVEQEVLPKIIVPQEMACTECHTDLVENEVMHYPAEDACDNCHESTGNEHPGDSLGFALMDQSPALCFYCHEEGIEIAHPHQPVLQGSCLVCHDAHGSANPLILKSAETGTLFVLPR